MLLRKCIFAGKNSLEMIYKISDYLGIPNLKNIETQMFFPEFFICIIMNISIQHYQKIVRLKDIGRVDWKNILFSELIKITPML